MISAMLVLPSPAFALSIDLQTHFSSFHLTTDELNERNPGLGLVFIDESGYSATVGGFINSFERESYYAGIGKRTHIVGFTYTTYVGVISGYYDFPIPAAMAQVQYGPFVITLIPSNLPALGFGLQLPIR